MVSIIRIILAPIVAILPGVTKRLAKEMMKPTKVKRGYRRVTSKKNYIELLSPPELRTDDQRIMVVGGT